MSLATFFFKGHLAKIRQLLNFGGGSEKLYIITDFHCLVYFNALNSLWTYLSLYCQTALGTEHWGGTGWEWEAAGGDGPKPGENSERAASERASCIKPGPNKCVDHDKLWRPPLDKPGKKLVYVICEVS